MTTLAAGPRTSGESPAMAWIARKLAERHITLDPTTPEADTPEPSPALEAAQLRIPLAYRTARVTHPQVATWVEAVAGAAVAPGDDPLAPHFGTTGRRRIAHGPSLLLWGDTGAGKTHQAYAAIRALTAAGCGVHWQAVKAADLYGQMRPRSGTDPESLLRRIARTPLLLLDDLGAAKNSEWTEEINFRLLSRRAEHHLPTLITTNLAPPAHRAHGPPPAGPARPGRRPDPLPPVRHVHAGPSGRPRPPVPHRRLSAIAPTRRINPDRTEPGRKPAPGRAAAPNLGHGEPGPEGTRTASDNLDRTEPGRDRNRREPGQGRGRSGAPNPDDPGSRPDGPTEPRRQPGPVLTRTTANPDGARSQAGQPHRTRPTTQTGTNPDGSGNRSVPGRRRVHGRSGRRSPPGASTAPDRSGCPRTRPSPDSCPTSPPSWPKTATPS
ncbi:ATP-binding protein [Streptomyces sp. cg36]|uniref:ATP-binding protein n=1 Tax=Streptomyces sp. cg36 TaxID=3238798 RepID=UPI0034E2900E